LLLERTGTQRPVFVGTHTPAASQSQSKRHPRRRVNQSATQDVDVCTPLIKAFKCEMKHISRTQWAVCKLPAPEVQLQSLPNGSIPPVTTCHRGVGLAGVARANIPSLLDPRGTLFRSCTRVAWCTELNTDPLRRPTYRRNSRSTMIECRRECCLISIRRAAGIAIVPRVIRLWVPRYHRQ
jgi:hypothetical protein